jgi:hypothetical protein
MVCSARSLHVATDSHRAGPAVASRKLLSNLLGADRKCAAHVLPERAYLETALQGWV